MIDLRSDTVTRPTPAMLVAIAEARLGDEGLDRDPTVVELETLSAELFDKEAAMLVISGTMGNLISLLAHTEPGDEVIMDASAHIWRAEMGGVSRVAGLLPHRLASDSGILDPATVVRALRPDHPQLPRTSLICIENTHAASGGTPWSLQDLAALREVTAPRGIRIHVDGARIFNAAVALDVAPAALMADADSVSFCLSKGLACPVGSVIVGSADFIQRARRMGRMLGSRMRQAGVIAAPGLVALRTLRERLRDDHANAQRLARAINSAGNVRVDLDRVRTNIVMARFDEATVDARSLSEALSRRGVLTRASGPHLMRLVTHIDVDQDDITQAASAIRDVMENGAR